MAAAVVADGGTDVVGNRVEAAQQLLQAPLSELGVLGQRIIEIRDVGLVMFAVVDLHGLRVDVGLQRCEVVRQRRKLVSRELLYLRHCVVRLSVLVQPRIARRGSLHILLRGTCCPLPLRRRSWRSFCCAGCTSSPALRGSVCCITSTSCRVRSWLRPTLLRRAPPRKSSCRARSRGFAGRRC